MRATLAVLCVLAIPLAAVASPPPIEACFDADVCAQKCAKGNAVACLRGAQLVDELGLGRDQASYKQLDFLLAKRCDSKDGRACYAAGRLHCEVACDATAHARFVKGCDLDDGASCAGAADDERDAAVAKPLYDKAWRLLDDGCAAGRVDDCLTLGLARRSGAQQDAAVSLAALRWAQPLLARDCDTGDTRACWWSSDIYFGLYDFSLENYDRSRDAHDQMCKLAPKYPPCVVHPLPPGASGLPGRRLPTAVVTIGEPTVDGELDATVVRRIVKRTSAQIRTCYEHALQTKAMGGVVVVDFTIDGKGAVASSTGRGFDKDVAHCVADAIKAREFRVPKTGEVKVSFPFKFRLAQD